MSELRYVMWVSGVIPRIRPMRLPDGSPLMSSPVSAVLVYGEHDAVLVDPPFTRQQTEQVAGWVERSGKRLTHIYSTHGHGDHCFGTAQLLDRFPDAIPYATEGTMAVMRRNVDARPEFWDADFPGLIGDTPLNYQPVPEDGFELEGHRLVPVEVGHTDTDETPVLHVPSIDLVVAGDAVYN